MFDTAIAIDQEPAREALAWPERAAALAITTPESYVSAGELLKGIKALRAKIAETFDPHIKRALEAHRALVAERRAAEDPLTAAEGVIKGKLVAYDAEQERLRRLEEQRVREEARRQEEIRRLEEAAELERQARERQAQAALLVDDEIAQQIAQQEAAELQTQAEATIAEPVEAPVVFVPKATPKVAGISYRETWSAQVVDAMALIRHVAAHPEHANLLTPNTTALNGLARSLRQSMAIPGVKAVATRQVASGR